MTLDSQSDKYKNYSTDFVSTPEPSPSIITAKKIVVEQSRPKTVLRVIAWTLLVSICVISALVYIVFNKLQEEMSPSILPTVIQIPKGSSLQTVTNILHENHLISSPLLFRVVMIFSGEEQGVKNGEYTFTRPLTMSETIDKLVNAKYEYTPVRLTIREGENAKEISSAIAAVFPKLNQSEVYMYLKEREGRVFPETYNFAPFATLDEIVKTIEKEFDKRMAVFAPEFASTTKTQVEILTIASILEREVPEKSDMKIVSGIIYNRLAAGMPLQMDSTVGYITGKASLELVIDDLQIDSPYNTYKVKGLPPTPIGNPGDVAIEAALNPDKNEYLFFLSDKNGVNHYAKTYAEHLKNRRVYLGK